MKFVGSATIGVVVPVHNAVDDLRRSLACLRAQQSDEAMVIVVDDGSTDGTPAFLRETTDVVAVTGDGSLWWSGAVEKGCREAIRRGASVILLWNDDNGDAAPDCVRAVEECVRRTGACVTPVVLKAPTGASASILARRILHAGGSTDWRAGVLRLREHGALFAPSSEITECEWLPGTALAFTTEVFQRLGGFDWQRFPQYRGDADFTLRARRAGVARLVLHSTWVENDSTRTGLAFDKRVSLREALTGLTTLKSNYHLLSTLRFFARHCPRRYLPFALALFYTKFLYATLKTWHFPREYHKQANRHGDS